MWCGEKTEKGKDEKMDCLVLRAPNEAATILEKMKEDRIPKRHFQTLLSGHRQWQHSFLAPCSSFPAIEFLRSTHKTGSGDCTYQNNLYQ